jgi:hypothetical protein
MDDNMIREDIVELRSSESLICPYYYCRIRLFFWQGFLAIYQSIAVIYTSQISFIQGIAMLFYGTGL